MKEEETPVENAVLKVSEPKRKAAGTPAVIESVKQVYSHIRPGKATRLLLALNQADGFDCPSCAWPDHDKAGLVDFCENGAKAVAYEADDRRITREFFARYSVGELAAQSDYWMGQQGRLTEPMVLRKGSEHYEPISWAEAFEMVGGILKGLGSPDEAIFYTSGRTSNEAAFLYQLFVRRFGTNNLPDCSNMCHESSGVALSETIGVGKGTVTLEDVEKADVVFLVGQNPGTNHPRMLTSLQKVVRNGGQLVAINPMKEAGLLGFMNPQQPGGLLGVSTPLCKLYLQVRINGDLAFFKGLMKELLSLEGAVDAGFVSEYTAGFDEFVADLRATPWPEIERSSGLSRTAIAEAARVAAGAKRLVLCWAMGLTQHVDAVATIQQLVNLVLMRGMLGNGAGLCPVRGHSNVQGDRTMGIYEKPSLEFLQRLGSEFGFEPPVKHGFDVVDSIAAMRDGRAKVFFAMGGNFLSACPDTEITAAALRRCSLTAHVSIKLNRSHLVTGEQALILPCLGRTELDVQSSGPQFVTVEDSMSMVHGSRGQVRPASPLLLSEPAIVAGLAAATLGMDWSGYVADYDAIRDAISRVIPGFEDFNARVRQPRGFYLGNAAARREFKVAGERARFTVGQIPPEALGEGELMLMTIRSHDQYNTSIYGLEDRYRGIKGGRRVVFLSAGDADERGLKDGDLVDLVSGSRVARAFRVVIYDLPARCAAAYFPEANPLVPLDRKAEKSGTPASKSIPITVRLADPDQA